MKFAKKPNVSTTSQGYTAFTLAEVLITLGIIGIIAAITIPTVVNIYTEKETVAKVKKYYSVLSAVTKQWQMENGCIDDASKCLKFEYASYDCKNSFAGIESKLNIVDARYNDRKNKLGQIVSINNINWLPDNSYNYDGTVATQRYVSKNISETTTCQYLFADGTTMTGFLDYSVNAAGWPGGNFAMVVDTNGKKKPNRVGKDQFPFSIGYYTRKSPKYFTLHPYYTDGNGSIAGGMCNADYTDCDPINGLSPTAYVVSLGKLPDLGALGFPKNP